MYKITDWELSVIPEDQIQKKGFADGLHVVKIVDAKYLDEATADDPKDAFTYSITVEDVQTGAVSPPLKYWLKNQEKTMFSEQTLGTMGSLGKAIFGPDFDRMVPAPIDVIGAVVGAEFKATKGKDGKSYARVFHYQPVSEDYSIYSDIEQYYKVKE